MRTKRVDEDQSSVAGIFREHSAVERAVMELKSRGVDANKLSVVGRDYYTDEHVIGFHLSEGQIRYCGEMNRFWNACWSILDGAAFLVVPGIGPIVVAGPVAGWIIGAIEGSIFVGGVSVLGAGMVSLGIPRQTVIKYETVIRAGKLVLIAYGTDEDARRVRYILQSTEAEEVVTHQMPPEPARAA